MKKSADADSGSDFKTPSGSDNDAASDSDNIPDTCAEKKQKQIKPLPTLNCDAYDDMVWNKTQKK